MIPSEADTLLQALATRCADVVRPILATSKRTALLWIATSLLSLAVCRALLHNSSFAVQQACQMSESSWGRKR